MILCFKVKDARFLQIVKMNTIPTVVNGATVFHIICLAKRGLTNPREPSRMVPEDNAGMTRIAHPGLQVVVLLVIAEAVLKNGTGMAVLDQKLIPNLAVSSRNGSKKMPKVGVGEIKNIMEKLKTTIGRPM